MKCWKLDGGAEIWLVLGGFYNSYLILFEDKRILVDTGRKSHRKTLYQNLRKLIQGEQHLDYLILTHTHYDHCENAAQLKLDWNCEVIVSAHESGFLKKGSTPLPKGTNVFTYVLSAMGNRFATDWYLYAPVYGVIELNNDTSIMGFPKSIEFISSPGHSVGSVSININNEIAIVGDTMFGGPNNSIMPHFADDKKELIKSWKLLLDKTNCHTFLPGHGKEIDRKRVEDEYRKKI